MSKTRFPKTVEFLRNVMLGKEGYDLELAQELTQLVSTLGEMEVHNAQLRAENEEMVNYLNQLDDEMAELEAILSLSTPQYPDDFYSYGDSPLSYKPNDEEIQDMVDEVYEIGLERAGFVEQAIGDTIVLKLKDEDGLERIIVAKGYVEYILDEEDEPNYEPSGLLF